MVMVKVIVTIFHINVFIAVQSQQMSNYYIIWLSNIFWWSNYILIIKHQLIIKTAFWLSNIIWLSNILWLSTIFFLTNIYCFYKYSCCSGYEKRGMGMSENGFHGDTFSFGFGGFQTMKKRQSDVSANHHYSSVQDSNKVWRYPQQTFYG